MNLSNSRESWYALTWYGVTGRLYSLQKLQLIAEREVGDSAQNSHMFLKAADHKVNAAENKGGIWKESVLTYSPVNEGYAE